MKRFSEVLPEEVTPLGVPIVLLDASADEFRAPDELGRQLQRLMVASNTSVVQFHLSDGAVYEFPAGPLDQALASIWPHVASCPGYAIGLTEAIPAWRQINVYDLIDEDTQSTLRDSWHPTMCAGVNELANAMEAGTASLRINLAAHTHRRSEFTRMVAEILARRRVGRLEFDKIRNAAMDTLSRIDTLAARQAEARRMRFDRAA